MYSCDELCYFVVYFPRCCATREINTKITLSWAHKQFATRVTVTYIILYVPQESRKIIAAMIQHIIYKEQLPMLMGDQIMKDFDLALADDGYYYGKIDRVCCLIFFRNYSAYLTLYQ